MKRKMSRQQQKAMFSKKYIVSGKKYGKQKVFFYDNFDDAKKKYDSEIFKKGWRDLGVSETKHRIISEKEWIKKPKDYKSIINNQKYVLSNRDGATILEPVEVKKNE